MIPRIHPKSGHPLIKLHLPIRLYLFPGVEDEEIAIDSIAGMESEA